MIKLFITLLTLLIVSTEAGKKSKHQQCSIRKMDRQATIVFVFGRRDVYLPKNAQEMIPHCKQEFEAEDYVRNYAKRCLKPFPKQIVGVILLGASNVIRHRCTPEGTQEYLNNYQCIKIAINHLHDCMDQLVITLKEITLKSAEERIPLACCAFDRYLQNSIKQIEQYCPNDSSAVDYIGNKMIKGYASEILDLGCQGYDLGNDKCKKLTLPNGNFVERGGTLVSLGNVTDRTLSLIPPFLDIFTKN